MLPDEVVEVRREEQVQAASLCKTDAIMVDQGLLDIDPPVIIGHEVSGVVRERGPGVEGLEEGQLVALDPPVPCRRCRVCRVGMRHMCPNTLHIGAHTPGGMAEAIAIDYRNAYPVPPGVSPAAASLAEPYATCLEALSQAGGVRGKNVCVFGDGPFGLIMSHLARRQGAEQVLLFGHHHTRMDRVRQAGVLAFDAREVDAGTCIGEHTEGYGAQVIVDTTGTRQVLGNALDWLMPRGVLVVFTPPGVPYGLDWDQVHFRELSIVGTCRSLDQFPEALRAIQEDVAWAEALITHRLSIEDVHRGFEWITQRKETTIKATIIVDD